MIGVLILKTIRKSQRKLLINFSKYLIITFLLLYLMVIIDEFTNVINLIKGQPDSFSIFLKTLLFRLPRTIIDLLKFAILFSSVFFMSQMEKSNNFILFTNKKIKFLRLIISILILSLLLTNIALFLNENIVPQFNHRRTNIIRKLVLGIYGEPKKAKEVNFYGEQRTLAARTRYDLKEDIIVFKKAGLKVYWLEFDYHYRLAEPFSILVFTIIGVAVGLKIYKRKRRIVNFIISFVLSILFFVLYYRYLTILRPIEIFPPIVAAWLPNFVFTILGIWLIRIELLKKDSNNIL